MITNDIELNNFGLEFFNKYEELRSEINKRSNNNNIIPNPFFILIEILYHYFVENLNNREEIDQKFMKFQHFTAVKTYKALLRKYSTHLSENNICKHNFCLNPWIMSFLFENINRKDSKELQKKSGVFYTPKLVSNYMTSQAIKFKMLFYINRMFNTSYNEYQEIFDKQSSNLTKIIPKIITELLPFFKILDNSCGTGEFLIESVNSLFKYWQPCITYLIQNKLLNKDIIHSLAIYLNVDSLKFENLFDSNDWIYYLKRTIISKNIFGIDIDTNALKIAEYRLNLLLLSNINENHCNDNLFPLEKINLIEGNALIGFLKSPSEKFDSNLVETHTQVLELKAQTNYQFYNQIQNNFKIQGITLENLITLKPFHWDLEFSSELILNGFSLIIGNPPYIRSRHLSSAERKLFSQFYKSAFRTYDIYVFFIERGLTILKEGQILSYLVPYSVLHQPYASKLRKFILSSCTILEIVDLSNLKLFNATIKVCILTVQKGKFNYLMTHSILVNQTIRTVRQIDTQIFLSLPNFSFKLELTPINNSIIETIEKNSINLKQIMHVSKGVEVYERGSGKKKDEYIHTLNINNRFKSYLEAKEIKRYTINWSQRFLNYQPERHCSPKFPELFENPKIIMKRIIGTKRLESTVDYNNFYVENTLICCLPKYLLSNHFSYEDFDINLSKEYDLEVVVGILNSKLMTFYFKVKLGDNLQIYNKSLEILPIPILNPKKIIIHHKIKSKTSQMLRIRNESSKGIQNLNNSKIKILDQTIDDLVFELYDLTKSQIKIINDSTANWDMKNL